MRDQILPANWEISESAERVMKHEFLRNLVCPDCRSDFELHVDREEAEQIRSGHLSCLGKGHRFPISNFVPRFVDTDQYADSFSKQRLYVRRHFKHYQNDKSGHDRFESSTGFDKEELTKGLTLEIGCGYGRYLDVVQSLGGSIVGVDLSTHSIDLAQDFVGLKKNVHLVQCDLFNLPFREEYFDRIFSLGVLHHTPDTRQAFRAIIPYLRGGGRVSIWVYDPKKKIQANRWRNVTTRLPHGVLYAFCIFNQAALSWIRALPGGGFVNRFIPGASPKRGQHFWQRVLSDFDSLSPRYAHTHYAEEVHGWFEEAGLVNIRSLQLSTSVTGSSVCGPSLKTSVGTHS